MKHKEYQIMELELIPLLSVVAIWGASIFLIIPVFILAVIAVLGYKSLSTHKPFWLRK